MGRKKREIPMTPLEKAEYCKSRKSPVINTTEGLMPGDNTRYIMQSMEIARLPALNIREVGVEEVEERMDDFFAINAKYDTKPTVAGMAMALGLRRQDLLSVCNGTAINSNGYPLILDEPVAETIKKNFVLMENLWENYMQNGKVNPVSGIFLGKNNYAYQDKVEHVVTPNLHEEAIDADAIRDRYLPDSTNEEE